jgi:hypothetical protein
MKIAICFSGHLRNFCEDQINQLQDNINILLNSGHDIDCFFSIQETNQLKIALQYCPNSKMMTFHYVLVYVVT